MLALVYLTPWKSISALGLIYRALSWVRWWRNNSVNTQGALFKVLLFLTGTGKFIEYRLSLFLFLDLFFLLFETSLISCLIHSKRNVKIVSVHLNIKKLSLKCKLPLDVKITQNVNKYWHFKLNSKQTNKLFLFSNSVM